MGSYCLTKICLRLLAAMAVTVGVASGEMVSEPASASIKVTATVVPSLGGSAVEGNWLSTSSAETTPILPAESCGAKALSHHRLLIRFPAVSSVAVSVESASGRSDYLSLDDWGGTASVNSELPALQPGALLVDLKRIPNTVTESDSTCTVTLIYTEN
jgi:hypothetical protein